MGNKCCADKEGELVKDLDERKVVEASPAVFDTLVRDTTKKEARVGAAAEILTLPTCEFTVKLKKDSPTAKLGCAILYSEDGEQVVISSPEGKVIEEWHKNNPTKQIIAGDEIVSVCGSTGNAAAIMDMLGKNAELDIVLRRHLKVIVEITKKGPLGVEFDSQTREVTAITQGALEQYNTTASPIVSIFVRDQLCGVNDKTSSSHNLLDEIKKFNDGDKITLIFERPPVETNSASGNHTPIKVQMGTTSKSAGTRDSRPEHKFKNGATYTGQWLGEVRHGEGVQVWSDGARYEGQWEDDKATGHGRFEHVDGDVYEGQWQNDKAQGRGKYKHKDGSVYDGEWLEDKQHGQGTETFLDGAKYEGQHMQGQKNGKGSFTWVDGSSYVGEFAEQNLHGEGKYKWFDGREYTGQWKNNRMDGSGVFKWNDGRSYEGQYKEDMKTGEGVFKWPDGHVYSGQWKDGKQHGLGSYTHACGETRQGEWEDGKRVKWLAPN